MRTDREGKPGATASSESPARADTAGLRSRAAGLRQAARLPRAQPQVLLDAALAELDAAVAALDRADGVVDTSGDGRESAGAHPDRRLLHAVFTATPLPLYVVDRDGTVLRANTAASELLGAGPGYATGRSLTTLIEPAARAALRSKLAAVMRTGVGEQISCGLLGSDGVIPSGLLIEPLTVRGDVDRMLVAIDKAPAQPGKTP